MTLARRQLAQTRKENERDLRRRGRQRLKELRQQVREAKQRRRARLREVSANCRAARRDITRRAKHARERLRQSVERTRARAQDVCSAARGRASQETLAAIKQRLEALEAERVEQHRLRLWARPAGRVLAGGRARAREQLEESDEEVEANLDDPGLRVVWRAVKGRIKGSKRRSRTEAFAEWAAEHLAEVYAIQEADAVAHLEQLEEQERKLASALKRGGKALDDVPF